MFIIFFCACLFVVWYIYLLLLHVLTKWSSSLLKQKNTNQIKIIVCLCVFFFLSKKTNKNYFFLRGIIKKKSLTRNGPYILEFNCRFGDPETQVVLPLLETDLYDVFTACCTGTLDSVDVRFKEGQSAATVVCAAQGYPEKYPKGMEIKGLDDADKMKNIKVYHAGTKVDDSSTMRCSGGRVLAVTGMGNNLKASLKAAYEGVRKLSFVDSDGNHMMHFRTDIGRKATQRKLRVGVLGSTRGTSLLPVMEACSSGLLHAEIVAVVSNRSSAPILDKGKSLGVCSQFVSAKGLSRRQHDAECTSLLVGEGVDCVLLIGYMRILSKEFCDYWKGRCFNVHPSLLPKHAGGMDLEVSYFLYMIFCTKRYAFFFC